MSEKHLAVVDIGSNTVHLLVAATDGSTLRPLLDESVSLRLGAEVDQNSPIPETKIALTRTVLADFITKSTMLGAPPPLILATAAVREAKNGEEFGEAINEATGLDLRVLSAEEEAYLDLVGAAGGVGGDGMTLVVDVGGGSTQVILGYRAAMLNYVSLPAGSGKLMSRFLASNPPSDAEFAALEQYLSGEFTRALPPAPGKVGTALAVGGTARRVPGLLNVGPTDVLSIDALTTAVGLLRRVPAENIAEAYNLDLARARLMLPGVMVLRQALQAYDVERFQVAEGSLREGALLLTAAGRPFTPPHEHIDVPPADGGFSIDSISLRKPSLYFNRELSWLQFNNRVLEEAFDRRNPLLERIKFVAITHSNLDEFFMVRVSGLREQVQAGISEPSMDGMSAAEELVEIRNQVQPVFQECADLLTRELLPALGANGISIVDYNGLSEKQQKALREYFEAEVFPVCTPLAVDPGHPFPHISNLSLNLAVELQHPDGAARFARVKVPNVLPRLVPVPGATNGATDGRPALTFVLLEQVLAANLDMLFPQMKIKSAHPFRVIRDADIEIQELESADLLESVEASINRRRFGLVVALFHNPTMPEDLRLILMDNLQIGPADCYTVDGPLGLSDMMDVYKLDRPELKDAPYTPRPDKYGRGGLDLFSAIQAGDMLLHHPFETFSTVVDFISNAADDPNVLAIKQTLYRVGSHSPIVEALLRAAEAGKQVAVLVELKARFDEENNIEWARALEQAGVHVTYGLIGLKTHCKVALVVRKERDGLRRYVHLGTGNYNPATARLYTDMGLLSCRPELGADASELFNFLTGYSQQTVYRKLLVAPVNMREGIIERIRREAAIHKAKGKVKGRIIFKMNSLVDGEMIEEMYKASQAGVRIDLIIRGICCLRPGVPGISDNIRVRSIVGRFLEHSRIYYFANGGNDEIYIGSADLMPRNLNNRVETLTPIGNAEMRDHILHDILELYLRDNMRARLLDSDGNYHRAVPGPDEAAVDAQATLMQRAQSQPDPAPEPLPARKRGQPAPKREAAKK